MTKAEKIALLRKIIEEAQEVINADFAESVFRPWLHHATIVIEKLFPNDHFRYIPEISNLFTKIFLHSNEKLSEYDIDCLKQQMARCVELLDARIFEVKNFDSDNEKSPTSARETFREGDTGIIQERVVKSPKIFISHAHENAQYANALVELLTDIGIQKSDCSIFCSSVKGYGIPVGRNIYDFLRDQFMSFDLFVFFLLSDDYYRSSACLNEMGAAWVLRKEYRTILLPGFNYSQISGAIDPRSLSIKLDENTLTANLNNLKTQLEEFFKIPSPVGMTIWEEDRRKFIEKITKNSPTVNEIKNNIDLDTFIAQEQAKQLTPEQLCVIFSTLANVIENTLYSRLQKIIPLFSSFSSDGMYGYSIEEEESWENLYSASKEFGKIELKNHGNLPHSVFLHRDMCLSRYKHVLNDDLSMALHIAMTDYSYSIGFEFEFSGQNPIKPEVLEGNSSSTPPKSDIERWIDRIVSEICLALSSRGNKEISVIMPPRNTNRE